MLIGSQLPVVARPRTTVKFSNYWDIIQSRTLLIESSLVRLCR